ncbi:MAG: hypothetical protein Q4D54_04350 [Eubacteriales bacterium]|nr:hypothetical protein [Eubacteriales bacterium]
MRNMNNKSGLIRMCIIMAVYIGLSTFIASRDIRAFKRSNGEVVYATIKSTSTYSERRGTGRHRHTRLTQTAEVEYTYNGETQTATVYKPFAKKVGDIIKLGITENGRILVLHMKFNLSFLIITAFFIGFLIVLRIKTTNKKEKAITHDPVLDSYMQGSQDDFFDNTKSDLSNILNLNQHENDMRDMEITKSKSELQTAAMIAQHTINNQSNNTKEDVDEVPKLKFELKKPLNHTDTTGENK